MTAELVEFLNRRLDVLEAAALELQGQAWHIGNAVDPTQPCHVHTFPGTKMVADGLNWLVAEHIALNNPESVLRRCAADRKMLELHAPQQDGSAFPDGLQCRTCSQDGGDGYQYLIRFPCPTLQNLAEGYGWTAG